MGKREVSRRPGANALVARLLVFLLVMATRTLAISAQPQVATGEHHTVGLKSDGTVVAVGRNTIGQCDVASWTEIVQVAAGNEYTVGLKSDGTVVAVGSNTVGQSDVGSWKDIVKLAAGDAHTV